MLSTTVFGLSVELSEQCAVQKKFRLRHGTEVVYVGAMGRFVMVPDICARRSDAVPLVVRYLRAHLHVHLHRHLHIHPLGTYIYTYVYGTLTVT